MIISVIGTKGGIGATTLLSNLFLRFDFSETKPVWFSLSYPYAPIFITSELKWEKLQTFRKIYPVWNMDSCTQCNKCFSSCTNNAISHLSDKHLIFTELCNSCKTCISACKNKSLEEKWFDTGEVESSVHGSNSLLKLKLSGREILSVWYIKEIFRFLKNNFPPGRHIFIDIPSGQRELWGEVLKTADLSIIYSDDCYLLDILYKSHSPRNSQLIFAVPQKAFLQFDEAGYSYAVKIPHNKEITQFSLLGQPVIDHEYSEALNQIFRQIKVETRL